MPYTMPTKNTIIPRALGVLLILVVAVAAWWKLSPTQSVTLSSTLSSTTEVELKTRGLPIKVARSYWPGMYWIDIAEEKGWFQEAGLNVELIDISWDYFKSIRDMIEGKIDVLGFSLFDVIHFNSQGADLVLVNYQSTSSGSQAIVARQEIEIIEALRGKKIGINKNGYMEYILDVVLAKNGLTLKDVTLVEISGKKAPEALLKGTVDAVVTWVPFIQEVLAYPNHRKLFDTSEIPGLVPGGSAFHQKFIEQRPKDVHAFINVWHRVMLFMKEHPKDGFEVIAKIYNVSPDDARQFVQVERIMDLRDNLTSFTYAAGFESLHGAARRFNDFMIKKGLTTQRLDSLDFLDDRFIRALEQKLAQNVP